MRRYCSIWFDLREGKDNVTFNLTRNERHFYDSQQSVEDKVEDIVDRELEMSLESGKVSQEEMMKELLELCGWNNCDEDADRFTISSTPPSDSGGSFTYDFSSLEVTDDSQPSTPTRMARRQASVSSLKFDSLRLNTSPYSRPAKLSRLPSVGQATRMPREQSSFWEDITQGIIREESFPASREPAEPQPSPEEEPETDFWNEVEF